MESVSDVITLVKTKQQQSNRVAHRTIYQFGSKIIVSETHHMAIHLKVEDYDKSKIVIRSAQCQPIEKSFRQLSKDTAHLTFNIGVDRKLTRSISKARVPRRTKKAPRDDRH